jgi:HAD superfamily hydrolase (TIGR01509 family)
MKIKAIIFDLDGVLIDSEPILHNARIRIAENYGKLWSYEDHVNILGTSAIYCAEYMIKKLELRVPAKALVNEVNEYTVASYKENIPFRSGAVEVVRLLSDRYPLALASGSPKEILEIITNSQEFESLFDVVVSSEELREGKPNPEIFLEAARRLRVEPDECVCIEDSANGVLAGRRANMFVINIPDPMFPLNKDESSNANMILNSLKELHDGTLSLIET